MFESDTLRKEEMFYTLAEEEKITEFYRRERILQKKRKNLTKEEGKKA